MRLNQSDVKELITYWIKSSDDDYKTMLAMYKTKRYSWSLFVGHLMIEKLLKANYIKSHTDHPPLIHNLLRLAQKCNLQLDDKRILFLTTVTAFNINARYDDYKMSFQKRCTPAYTTHWISQLKENRTWIKQQIAT